MALRHALLAALLDGPATGYELTKWFDAGVANFWHATKPQLYAELSKLERAGLVSVTEVHQRDRPNKRVMAITDEGVATLDEFSRAWSKPAAIKSDLVVKVRAMDVVDPVALRLDVVRELAMASAKLEAFEATKSRMLKGRTHDEYVATARHVGPYLTLQLGIAWTGEHVAWLREVLEVIDARQATRSSGEPIPSLKG